MIYACACAHASELCVVHVHVCVSICVSLFVSIEKVYLRCLHRELPIKAPLNLNIKVVCRLSEPFVVISTLYIKYKMNSFLTLEQIRHLDR